MDSTSLPYLSYESIKIEVETVRQIGEQNITFISDTARIEECDS